MARKHGQQGRLYVGIASSTAAAEPIAFLREWSIDFTTDKVEVTSFEDGNKTYVAGKEDTSGSYSGWYDSATEQLYTAATDGTARRFYLYPDATVGTTGDYWFGSAFFDMSLAGAVDGAVSINGNWNASTDISKQSGT